MFSFTITNKIIVALNSEVFRPFYHYLAFYMIFQYYRVLITIISLIFHIYKIFIIKCLKNTSQQYNTILILYFLFLIA